ncbi:MAG: hypothetical protein Rubg2KO_36320 [Rubricoccaceae bacterium]
MSKLSLGLLMLAMLAACAPASSTSSTDPAPVRAELVLTPEARSDDPSLLVAQYREWDSNDQRIANIELDHGHGPADEDDDDDEVRVLARVGDQTLPIQALDADGDRVLVDLDALPMGRHVLRLTVVHDGLTSDELAVPVLDRRHAAP